MKTKTNLTSALSLSLFAVGLGASPLMAANIVLNGDFSANASAFTSFPGYLASGANPQIESWVFADLGGLAGINGDGTAVGDVFAPATTVDISNYAFIQNTAALTQGLLTMLPDQKYSISVAAAGRDGYAGTGRIQIGDAVAVFYTSGDQSYSSAAFQTITATFTTPSTFTGTPSIQLYGFSADGNSVAYTNVVLEAIPEPTSITLLGGALLFSVLRRRR